MYFVKPCLITNSTLILPSSASVIKKLDELEKEFTIKFGIKTINVSVIISDTLEENQISISENVIDYLKIPQSCCYQLLLQNREFTIGPFIGILAEITEKKLAYMLPTFTSFLKGYKKIGGAVIVFSLESIREDNHSVAGFLYKPEEEKWVYGRFPYPAAVMSIVEASLTSSWKQFQHKMKHLITVLGPKVFNFPHFSKWEMYNLLKTKYSDVLPETIVYEEPMEIKAIVDKYGSAYVKPLNGRLGRQVFKVSKTMNGVVVRYGRKEKKQTKFFSNRFDFIAFFKEQLVPREFLIQQTIPLVTYEDQVIDFRIMMVKNEHGLWESIGIFSRYGAKGSIVSNITAGGHTEIADLTLKKVWKLSPSEIEKVKANMLKVTRETLKTLEDQGFHCGNIGFDIGLDKDCNIYIIEINNQNPDPYIAIKANKKNLFYLARYKNMLYAKHLAGF